MPNDNQPERRLAAAVIQQSVIDLFSSYVSCSTKEEGDYARFEALRFLTAPGGEWARARCHWCSLADWDDVVLRRRIVAILEGGDINLPDGHFRLNGIEMARSLWEAEKQKERAHLDDLKRQAKERRTKQAEARQTAAYAEAHRVFDECMTNLRRSRVPSLEDLAEHIDLTP